MIELSVIKKIKLSKTDESSLSIALMYYELISFIRKTNLEHENKSSKINNDVKMIDFAFSLYICGFSNILHEKYFVFFDEWFKLNELFVDKKVSKDKLDHLIYFDAFVFLNILNSNMIEKDLIQLDVNKISAMQFLIFKKVSNRALSEESKEILKKIIIL